ncbi:immunoglobulin domain-containing protein [Agromyces atrinae]|uniref:immunoglobulin domain-containing protein n=1 Tax=Agromyces atrinae TaxID=592376 RepID=UPI00241364AA|nr:hypothetical protein [Agromyces atrinae]
MPSSPLRARLRNVLAAGLTAGLAISALMVPPTVASAEPADGATPITAATVEFGFNDVHQGASPFGGCNFFVAGTAPGLGADYTPVAGDVYVVKKLADGSREVVDVASRCTPAPGSTTIDQRFLFTEGHGSTSADGTVIDWEGAGTVNAYGGLVNWYFENPRLTLDAEGDGSIRARVGGFGSSMDDPEVKVPLEPRDDVEIARVVGAEIIDGALTIDPVWRGVDYFPLADAFDPTSERKTVSAVPEAAKAANPNWGSWPESFVDFQYTTGLSSYWHTSGLAADGEKPPLPIAVTLDGTPPAYGVLITLEPSPASILEGESVSFTGGASSPTGAVSLQWQVSRDGGDWVDIPDATGVTLSLTDVTAADWNGASIRFVATSGGTSATSSAVTLVVTAESLPVFDLPPVDTEVSIGNEVVMMVQASAYPRPSIRWERLEIDGMWSELVDGVESWDESSMVSASLFYLPAATAEDDGMTVRAIATNSSGSTVSDPATIRVLTVPASISSQPDDIVMFAGGRSLLNVGIAGAPYPSVRWETSVDDGATWIDSGRTGEIIELPEITTALDGTRFRAVVSNDEATVVSDVVSVRVLDSTSGPAHVWPSVVDPAADTTVQWVLNSVPELIPGAQGSFVSGILETSVWQPGAAPVTQEAFVPGTTATWNARNWSYRVDSISIAAGALDATKEYGFAWFWLPADGVSTQPAFDAFVPITLEADAPTEPGEPTEPTEPGQPTEPEVPSEPSEPAQPSEPTEPAEPTASAAPVDVAADPTSSTLARTGVDAMTWSFIALALLLGAGTVIVTRRRLRRH